MDENPYEAPQKDPSVQGTSRVVQRMGATFLAIGLACLAYGGLAFWVFADLPLNWATHSRLPSIYLMGVGIAMALVGLSVQSWANRRNDPQQTARPNKEIPTSIGLLLIIAIVIAFFVVVSRL